MSSQNAPNPTSQRRTSPELFSRLSAMMFLQYWPLGVWGVTVGTFIAANTGDQGEGIFTAGFIGYSTAAGALGGMLSPVLVGYLSDRRFSAERLLAFMNGGCGMAAWQLFRCQEETQFFLWLFVYYQCFLPAVTLTNTIALRNLADVEREYPLLRVFGTIGWIAAGVFVGLLWPLASGTSIEATRIPLALGAGGNLIMIVFALTLPHTPPAEADKDAVVVSRSDFRRTLSNRPLALFLFVALLASVPSMAYNNFANPFLNQQGYAHAAAIMTLGQASDILCLIAAPWFIGRIGLQRLFLIGTLAWGIRYGLLTAGSAYHVAWPVILAIAIHGPCYVFIYVVSVLYVDKLVDPAYRGSAQGLLALASTGLGHLLGAMTVGVLQSAFLTPEGISPPPYRWPEFWLVPAAICLLAAILFTVVVQRTGDAHG